jgi:hypothetical protein
MQQIKLSPVMRGCRCSQWGSWHACSLRKAKTEMQIH